MLTHNSTNISNKKEQKQWFITVFVTVFWCLIALNSTAFANTATTAAVEQTPIVNTLIIAELDSSIIVKLDGETLESTEVHRADNGGLYVNAMPIFQSLGNQVEFDAQTNALIVRRSQDGVVMELYTDTGIVKADGRPLGKLNHFGEVSDGRYLLTANAIAVLSGATGRFKAEDNVFDFRLDPRLKVATGFDIFVNDIALGNLTPAPKSVGPVLLLPLLPIAEELGHSVQVIEGGSVVKVRRAQDSAVLTLNLETGLIKIRDNPIGLSKDIAYIDATNLLLPVSAIETLTGTHVKAQGGSNRINIDLDDRLTGAIKPTASVDEIAKNTPFTPESLSFTLGPDTINQVEFRAHAGRVNGRLRYEMPDLPMNAAELQPSWLSVDLAHTNGMTGSLGDYAADQRELDGVGLRRIRGVSVRKVTDKGRWAVAAGVPVNGGEQISDDQSRQTFGGVAAGIRFADRDGWEAGLSYKKDSLTDDQMAVLSAISGKLGRVKDKEIQWDTSASLGYFNGDARESAVDLRLAARGRYIANEVITFDAAADYDGAEFLRTDLEAEDQERAISELTDPDSEIDTTTLIPDTRRRGLDRLAMSATARFTPQISETSILDNPAGSLRVSRTESGAFKNGDLGSTITTIGGSVATGLRGTGVSLSADTTVYKLDYADQREGEKGRQFNVGAYKQFEDYTVRAQYRNDQKRGSEVEQSFVGTVTRSAFNVPLPKDGNVSISPSVRALWNGDDISAQGGIYANLNSGNILGEKTKLSASLGVLQSLSSQSSNGQNQTDKFLTVALSRRVRLGKNMAVGLAYRNDLNGDQRIGLQLDGRFEFNEARKYRETKDGRGVLKGRTFLDKNRDGIKQDDERAIPRTLVRIKGTRMALRTDNAGYFTIQNIKEGIYEVQIDAQSLPLGFDLSEDVSTRVTISDGQISDVPLPIVQRGQIRGFTYVDENENGAFDKGEDRVEGAKLILKPADGSEPKTVYSSSFGQYAFDDLPAGEYEIVTMDNKKAGLVGGTPVTINLSDADDLMARANLIVGRRKTPIRHAEVVIEDIETPSESTSNTLTAVPQPDTIRPDNTKAPSP